MVIKARENLVGAWAFSIGVVLAVGIGIIQSQITGAIMPSWVLALLLLLGLLIGFFNVAREMNTFLLAGVSLVVVSFMGVSIMPSIVFLNFSVGKMLSAVLSALLILFIPATIIVALKTLFASSRV
jgi:uncharacterized membrane protein